MKKLFFAAACAALLASCASTPTDDGTAATAPQPIARASEDEPDIAPQTDDEIIAAESTDDTLLSAPADEPKPNDGQPDNEIARAETIPGSIRWLTNENGGQNIGTAITEKTDDAQTDGTETAHDNEPATRVTDADEIIADADILPAETAEYAPVAMAHQFLEPKIFDEPDPDIPVITVSDADTIPMQQQTEAAQTETTASQPPLPQNTDEPANQANETDAPQGRTQPAAQTTANPAQNANALANRQSEIAAPQNTMQPATQTTTNPAQNANTTANQANEIDATRPVAQSTTNLAQNANALVNRQSEPQGTTQSATQATTNPAQNANMAINRQSETDAQHKTTQSAAQNTANPAQNTNRQSEIAVPRSTTQYTAAADDAQSEEDTSPQSQTITPSRTVTMKNNQYLDVVYPGSGWVYLGETEANRDTKKEPIVSYFGRKLGTTDTTFSLRSRKPGKTLLHFYKNDALTGQYIDDYLEVSIENESAAAGQRTTAPAYAQVVPPKPSRQTRQSYDHATLNATETKTKLPENDTARTAEQQPASPATAARQQNASPQKPAQDTPPTVVLPTADERGVRTVIQTTESAPGGDTKPPAPAPSYGGATAPAAENRTQTAADESGADLLEQAKRAYADKQYENALDLVQRYLDDATEKIDEALFLQGQILEADSSIKSIRSAIDSYETLTKNYPMSALWKKANNRVIYLKRFYIEIR